jgi:hypothetical protein
MDIDSNLGIEETLHPAGRAPPLDTYSEPVELGVFVTPSDPGETFQGAQTLSTLFPCRLGAPTIPEYMTGQDYVNNSFFETSGCDELLGDGFTVPSPFDASNPYLETICHDELFRGSFIVPNLSDAFNPNDLSQAYQDTQTLPTPTPVQAPRARFICSYQGCSKSFKRAADLNRHRSSYHKIDRHGNPGYLCPVVGCRKSYGAGYSREDKVKEHLWKQHGSLGYVKDPIARKVSFPSFAKTSPDGPLPVSKSDFVENKMASSGSVTAGFSAQTDHFSGTLEHNFATEERTITPSGPSSSKILNLEWSDLQMIEIGSGSQGSEPSDTESVWISDFSEGLPVLEEDHPFLLIKPMIVREGLLSFRAWEQRAQGGSGKSESGTPLPSKGKGKSNTSPGEKRSRQNSNNDEDTKERQDEDNTSGKRPRISKKTIPNHLSFACPFAKKDPLKYGSCYKYILRRIRDVKQHLSRIHQQPIYCPRCMDTFETEEERDEHIRETSCELRAAIRFEGVTRALKQQLTERVSGDFSDQWFAIFDILFPGHMPRPKSPYMNFELTRDLERFQDFMHSEGPNLISATIRSRGINLSAMPNEERDLSTLLSLAIEDGLHNLAQIWSTSTILDLNESEVAVGEGSSSSHSSGTVGASCPPHGFSATLVEQSLEHPIPQIENHFPPENNDDEFINSLLTEPYWPRLSSYTDVPQLPEVNEAVSEAMFPG